MLMSEVVSKLMEGPIAKKTSLQQNDFNQKLDLLSLEVLILCFEPKIYPTLKVESSTQTRVEAKIRVRWHQVRFFLGMNRLCFHMTDFLLSQFHQLPSLLSKRNVLMSISR